MTSPASMPWGEFSADPRDPASAPLRASDRDRDVVLGVLAEAYADGRLTRAEYDERVDAVGRTRTLGELPGPVADLVPLTPPRPGDDLVRASTDELHRRALDAYAAHRRSAATGLAMTTAVLTVIWFVAGHGFYWPVFVILFAGLNLVKVLANKGEMVAKEQRKLEEQRRRSIDPPAS